MTQNEKIKRALLAGKKVSPLSALREFGCFRLAARIHELRKAGVPIRSERRRQKGATYNVYKLDRQ